MLLELLEDCVAHSGGDLAWGRPRTGDDVVRFLRAADAGGLRALMVVGVRIVPSRRLFLCADSDG